MGSDRFSLPILRRLLQDDTGAYSVVGVVTQPDRPAGRGRKTVYGPVKAMADRSGIPVLQPERVRSTAGIAAIAELAPDVLIVAAYGQILPQQLLDLPPHGALNLHPSLLPRFRGPSPAAATILAGDAETGTTLMLLEARMDAGPIISQETSAVLPIETAGELEDRLAATSAALLARDLPQWLAKALVPTPQDDANATYTHLLGKEDGRIDWSDSAEAIARRVRAMNPWPVAHMKWQDRSVRIWTARACPGGGESGRVLGLLDNALAIGTGDGLLLIDELQLPGARVLPARAVISGYPDLLTAQVGA